MYLVDGTVVTSASDLKKASECEFAFLRELDAKLGRDTLFEPVADAMLERSGRMGDAHEHRVLEAYRAAARVGRRRDRAARRARRRRGAGCGRGHAGGVRRRRTGGVPGHVRRRGLHRLRRLHRAPARRPLPRAGLEARPSGARHRAPPARGLRRAAPARRRAVRRHGRAAARRRVDQRAPPRRHRARLPAAPRAARADRRRAARRRRPGRVGRPALRARRALPHVRPRGAGAPRRAARRRAARHAARRPLRGGHRHDRRARGIRRPRRPASSTPRSRTCASRRGCSSRPRRRPRPSRDASGLRSPDDPPLPPPVVVRDAASLAAIPEPDAGDLFFDFEGDPLYTEGAATDWGLDYLFGMVDTAERFTPLWAHSFAEERVALEQFLALVAARRAAHPNMHIYHYASYERTHLLTIAARHGVGEAAVDQLLADGVLVDLYPIVKRARAGRQPLVLDQEARAALHGHRAARGRGEVGRRLDPRVRARPRTARHGRARPGHRARRRGGRAARARRPRRLQPLRLRVDAAAARLAARARPRGRRRARARVAARRGREGGRQGLRGLPARDRAAAARRAARRPRPRRRPHRARPRGRRDRLPRPRGEELLVGALLPRRAAARGVGGPPRRARRRPRQHPR